MKKKILEIFMWGICIVALAVMSTVVVREYQKSQNSLEIIQQQIETIAAQIEEVNKANNNLEKRITEFEKKQEEDKNRESIEKTTVEDQEQNESVDLHPARRQRHAQDRSHRVDKVELQIWKWEAL